MFMTVRCKDGKKDLVFVITLVMAELSAKACLLARCIPLRRPFSVSLALRITGQSPKGTRSAALPSGMPVRNHDK